MVQTKAKVVKNIKVAQAYYKILLDCAAIAKAALPGQFINIRVSGNLEPLLRRPLSIHRVIGSNIEMLYEVLGKGTKVLYEKRAGEPLDIIGPLGNGFTFPLNCPSAPVLVAGGMGVAPLVFLAGKLSKISVGKTLVLIGGKTKSHILCEKEFKDLGCDVKISTDDGSRGFHGHVTELLERSLSTVNCQLSTIYACGPKPMLREIGLISKKYKITAQVSLEEHMACGIGVCLGCVANTKEGFARVCKEGPVFDAQEIIWRVK